MYKSHAYTTKTSGIKETASHSVLTETHYTLGYYYFVLLHQQYLAT